MEDLNDRKWRILTKRSSRRCTAASSWDKTAPHLTDVVKTQRTLVILVCCHDHTTAGVIGNCPTFLHFNLNVFYELLKTDVHPYTTSRGQNMTTHRPVLFILFLLLFSTNVTMFVLYLNHLYVEISCTVTCLNSCFWKMLLRVWRKSLFIFQFSSSILFINDSNMTESGWRWWAGHTEQLIISAQQCWRWCMSFNMLMMVLLPAVTVIKCALINLRTCCYT